MENDPLLILFTLKSVFISIFNPKFANFCNVYPKKVQILTIFPKRSNFGQFPTFESKNYGDIFFTIFLSARVKIELFAEYSPMAPIVRYLRIKSLFLNDIGSIFISIFRIGNYCNWIPILALNLSKMSSAKKIKHTGPRDALR